MLSPMHRAQLVHPYAASRRRALVLAVVCSAVGCSRVTPESVDGSATESSDVALPNASPVIPMKTTPASELEPTGYRHTEVLRIRRDFGNESFQIVLDAWVPEGDPARIEDVRLWWYRAKSEGARGPFSEQTQRHFDIVYDRRAPDRWDVHMISDRKRFTFAIELDASGTPVAFGDVVLPGGGRLERCRALSGSLQARRFLGAPVGIKRLDIRCLDAAGNQHEGRLSDRGS
jgi:hypothetical protein